MLDDFLASLLGKVVYLTDHLFAISGDSIACSVVSFRARAFDPVNPIPGSSKDGNSIMPFICSLVSVSTSSLPSVVGTGDAPSAGVSGSVSALPPPLLVSLACLLLLLHFPLLCRLLLFFLLFLVFFFLLSYLHHLPPLFLPLTLSLLL